MIVACLSIAVNSLWSTLVIKCNYDKNFLFQKDGSSPDSLAIEDPR